MKRVAVPRSASPMQREFLVARNADSGSSLPFLVYLPVDGGLWLKVRESWPRGSRVYCHPVEGHVEVPEADVLERVVVMACERRGPAIDLVLARGINKRSQFVFTTFKNRRMIFWQTPKTAAASRPGVRIPVARANADATFLIDTRERYGYSFEAHGAKVLRRALPAGDYAVADGENRTIAVVERKSADDFVKSLVDGSINFAMSELATQPLGAVVVEAMYSKLLKHEYTRPGFIADVIARVQVRYPTVPIIFAESRKIAQEWTFRFLRAAHANAGGLQLSAMPGTAMSESKSAPPPERKNGGRKAKPKTT